MVYLELTRDDADTLRQVLENYLSDLRMEIADTDSLDYRETLKARKAVLRRVVTQLEEHDVEEAGDVDGI